MQRQISPIPDDCSQSFFHIFTNKFTFKLSLSTFTISLNQIQILRGLRFHHYLMTFHNLLFMFLLSTYVHVLNFTLTFYFHNIFMLISKSEALMMEMDCNARSHHYLMTFHHLLFMFFTFHVN